MLIKQVQNNATLTNIPDENGHVEVPPFIIRSSQDASPVEFDEDGNEIYVMPIVHIEMMDLSGNIGPILISSSRMIDRSDYGTKYTRLMIAEKLQIGYVPVGACPYSVDSEYRDMFSGRDTIVKTAKPVRCGGVGDHAGCDHFAEVKARRSKLALERHNKLQSDNTKLGAADIARLVSAFRPIAQEGSQPK